MNARVALKAAEHDVRHILRLLNSEQPASCALDAARQAHDKICKALIIRDEPVSDGAKGWCPACKGRYL